jgi:hypothetical protein
MIRKSCCSARFVRFDRTNRLAHGHTPRSADAPVLAQAPNTNSVNLKVNDFAFVQKNDLCPNRTARRDKIDFSLNPHVRHVSCIWPLNKKHQYLTRNSFNSLAVNRVFFPTPPPVPGAPRQLPELYWQAPQLILPAGVRCNNFTGVCGLPPQDQQRYIALAVARARNRGEDITQPPPLNLCPSLT